MNDLIFKLLIYCIIGTIWTMLRMLGKAERIHRKLIERDFGLYGAACTVALLLACVINIILWPCDITYLFYSFVKERGSD